MLPVQLVPLVPALQVGRCFFRRFSASPQPFRSRANEGTNKRFAGLHAQNELQRFAKPKSLSALNPRGGPLQFTSSGNVQTDLDSFLATVNRRLENLLYTGVPAAQYTSPDQSEEFERIVTEFRNAVMTNLLDRLGDGKYYESPLYIPSPDKLYETFRAEGIRGLDRLISQHYNQYFQRRGTSRLKSISKDWMDSLIADMNDPGSWYPHARDMRRKIIMHVGPTNSGKTYQALKRLETAERGWYGGPLRLLAHEIFNRMNKQGIKCNLRTGEEIRVVDPNAPLTSSTIEMFDDSALYDVAVVDEIQMIADPQRGYAWTAAVLGLRAKELHLCGEEGAVPLVSKIAEELCDEIEVRKYERLSPLEIDQQSVRSYSNILPGDCVVAFSRKEIFRIKEEIETKLKTKCAMVYGALPPETRAMQADLFNDPNSGYDVIVASDAIGMGLNLNIKRVIFQRMVKFDSGHKRPLYPSQIKQIAGRAGRFRVPGLQFNVSASNDIRGVVTTLKQGDIKALDEGLSSPNLPLKQAMLWPPWRIFQQFAQQFPEDTPLSTVLSEISNISKTSHHYNSMISNDPIILASAMQDIPDIDLESRYSLVFVPVNSKSPDQVEMFRRFANVLSNNIPITIEAPQLDFQLEKIEEREVGQSSTTLFQLEAYHKLITCYCWLSIRWPALFTDHALAMKWKERVEVVIHEALQRLDSTTTGFQPDPFDDQGNGPKVKDKGSKNAVVR